VSHILQRFSKPNLEKLIKRRELPNPQSRENDQRDRDEFDKNLKGEVLRKWRIDVAEKKQSDSKMEPTQNGTDIRLQNFYLAFSLQPSAFSKNH